jgi:hypothetical protein
MPVAVNNFNFKLKLKDDDHGMLLEVVGSIVNLFGAAAYN